MGRPVAKPLGWSTELLRAPQGALRAQRQANLARIPFWRAGERGSVALSWGPGLVHKAAEGSSGMLFPLLVPALVSLPGRT